MKKSKSRYYAIADCIKDGITSIKRIADELGVVTQDSEPKIIFYPWKENKTFEKVKEKVKTFERCDFGTYNGMEFYIVSDCTKKRIKLYFHAA